MNEATSCCCGIDHGGLGPGLRPICHVAYIAYSGPCRGLTTLWTHGQTAIWLCEAHGLRWTEDWAAFDLALAASHA